MISDIGVTAGKIWEKLGEKGQMSVAQLPRSVKEKSQIAYQALGWLARENKIQYDSKKGGQPKVSLTPMEQKNYDLWASQQSGKKK